MDSPLRRDERHPVVDFYKVLVDPATGNYLAGYNADATHPAAPGRIAMANALVTTLQPLLSPSPVIIPQDNADPNNLLTNGCFVTWTAPRTPPTITIGTVATGGTLTAGTYFYKVTVLDYQGESLPSNEVSVTITAGQQPQLTIPAVSGQRVLNIDRSTTTNTEVLLAPNVATGSPAVWSDSGSLTPGTATVPTADYTSYPSGWVGITGGPQKTVKVTDAAFQGSVTRLLATGSTQGQLQSVAMAGKFSVGDSLALVGITRSGGQTPNLQFKFNGGSAPNAFSAIADGATTGVQGVYYKEIIVPTGTTSLDVFIQNDAGASGSADFGQIGVYNLTTLGVI
jgi:hypothetical protein